MHVCIYVSMCVCVCVCVCIYLAVVYKASCDPIPISIIIQFYPSVIVHSLSLSSLPLVHSKYVYILL